MFLKCRNLSSEMGLTLSVAVLCNARFQNYLQSFILRYIKTGNILRKKKFIFQVFYLHFKPAEANQMSNGDVMVPVLIYQNKKYIIKPE